MSEKSEKAIDSTFQHESSQSYATLQMHIDQVISMSINSPIGPNNIAISGFQQYVASKFRQLYAINEAKSFLNDVFVSISFHSLHNDSSLYLIFAAALIEIDIGDKSFKANRIAKDLNNLTPLNYNFYSTASNNSLNNSASSYSNLFLNNIKYNNYNNDNWNIWYIFEKVLLWLKKQLGTAMNVTVNMLRDKMIQWFVPSNNISYLSSLHILNILLRHFPISITNMLGDAERIVLHSIQSDEESIRDLGCQTLESALSIKDTPFHFMCISISHLLFSETNVPSEGLINAVYSVIKSAPGISTLFTFAEAPIERLAHEQSSTNFKLLVLSYRCTPILFTDEDITRIMSLFMQFMNKKNLRKMTLTSLGEIGFLSFNRLQEDHQKDVKSLISAIWPKNVKTEEEGFALLSLISPNDPNFADQFNSVLALPLSKLILDGIRKFVKNYPATSSSIRKRLIPLFTPIICDLKDHSLALDSLETMIFLQYAKNEVTLPLLVQYSQLLSVDDAQLSGKMADFLIYFQNDFPILRFRLISFISCSTFDDLRVSVFRRIAYSNELCDLCKSLLNDRNSKLALETMKIFCEYYEKETIRAFLNDSIVRFPYYDSTRYRHFIKMYLLAAHRFLDLFEPICDVAFHNFLQIQFHFPASLELLSLLLKLKPQSDRKIIEILETHLKFHSTIMILKSSLDLLLSVIKYTEITLSDKLLSQLYEVSRFAEDRDLQNKLFHVVSYLAKLEPIRTAKFKRNEFGAIPLIYSLGSRNAFTSLTYASVAVSLNLLFEIVGDDSLASLHFSALEALIRILKNFRYIGDSLSEILVKKMSIFIANSIPSTVSLFLNNFSLFAMVFGDKLKSVIPNVIDIICKNWGTLDISLLLRITEWIIMFYKSAFKPYIFRITSLFISDLFARPPESVNLIFSTFVSYGSMIREVHSLVIPAFLDWIDNTNANSSIINDVLMKLRSILIYLNDPTYGLTILRTLSSLIQRMPEDSHERIMDIFCIIVIHMKSDFIIFYPEFSKLIEQHQTPQLKEVIQCLAERRQIPRNIISNFRPSFIESKQKSKASRSFDVSYDSSDYKPPKFTLPSKDFSQASWEQWIDDTATLFIQSSMSKAISASSAISEKHNHMKMSLFPIALALSVAMSKNNQIWKDLFTSVFTSDAPLFIVRLFLSTIEFLEAVHIERPISCEILAEKALDAGQIAQSLRYTEIIFKINPMDHYEQLIRLNQKLGLQSSANGVFRYIKNSSQKVSFGDEELIQLLGFWEDALIDINSKLDENPNDSNLLESKMTCLYQLSRFEELGQIAEKISPIFAAISAWNKLDIKGFKESFAKVQFSDDDTSNIPQSFIVYHIIYLVSTGKYDKAKELIEIARNNYATNLFPLLLDDYERVKPIILKGTILCEIEEIINIKENESNLSESALKSIKKVWNKRLFNVIDNENNQKALYGLILVRSFLLDKKEMNNLWNIYLDCAKKKGLTEMSKTALNQTGNNSRAEFMKIKSLYNSSPNEALILLQEKYSRDKCNPYTLCKWLMKVGNYREAEKVILDVIANPNTNIPSSPSSSKRGGLLQKRKSNLEDDDKYLKTTYNNSFGLSNSNGSLNMNTQLSSINANKNWKAYFLFSNCCESSIQSFEALLHCVALNPTGALKFTPKIFSTLFSYKNAEDKLLMIESFRSNFSTIPSKVWLFHLPQIISMLGTEFNDLMIELLLYIATEHCQDVVQSLVASSRSGKNCSDILNALKSEHPKIIEELTMFSDELIRIASCWYEIFNSWLDEASRSYVVPKERDKFEKILAKIQKFFSQQPTSIIELQFVTEFGPFLSRAEDYYSQYLRTKEEMYIHQIWEVYVLVFKKLRSTLEKFTSFNLHDVSPWLSKNMRDSQLTVPFCPDDVHVKLFYERITIISSKQRPRKLLILGDNGRHYSFLLKANEDTRLDERIMQFFTLYNSLVPQRSLCITTYGIRPLSNNVGLIGWVSECKTLFDILREYRERWGVDVNAEMHTTLSVCPNFERILGEKRYAPFCAGLQATKGDDIKEVLVSNAIDASHWLLRRNVYTTSMSSNSIVGYIIGLGDRHFGNIMMKINSAKLVHIDFGDSFEVTRTRKTFPETVPFRLTRIMVNALEAAGIEGAFRETCEQAMLTLRQNRKLVLGVLETFVTDPVLVDREKSDPKLILNRIDDKLNGIDFERKESNSKMSVEEQVDIVIREAMDRHNLCKMFSGWRPWW